MNLIKRIRDEHDLTNKDIAEITGKSPPTISRYLNGDEIPKDVIDILSVKFGYEKPKTYPKELDLVSLDEVQQRTGISKYLLQLGLKQNKFNFGIAIKGKQKKYRYFVFRGAFERFIAENK